MLQPLGCAALSPSHSASAALTAPLHPLTCAASPAQRFTLIYGLPCSLICTRLLAFLYSVERMIEYYDEQPEALPVVESRRPLPDWPQQVRPLGWRASLGQSQGAAATQRAGGVATHA